MSQHLQHHDHKLVEFLTLKFADTTYQRKSTPAGRQRKSAFSKFAESLPPRSIKWAVCAEEPRRVFVLSSWEPGTYDTDRSVNTLVKPLEEYLSGMKWSRLLMVLDETSVDITSPLWGPFIYELRILDFPLPDVNKQEPSEYWKELEGKISKALDTVKTSLTRSSSISRLPPDVESLGYLGLSGGWVIAEDGNPLGEGSQQSIESLTSRKWAAVIGWQTENGERQAWGEDGAGKGQECLQTFKSTDGDQRWHATKFEAIGTSNEKYQFSSSDEDDT